MMQISLSSQFGSSSETSTIQVSQAQLEQAIALLQSVAQELQCVVDLCNDSGGHPEVPFVSNDLVDRVYSPVVASVNLLSSLKAGPSF